MIQRNSIGAILVTLTATTSFAQTITETFDTGIPASWTIHDNFPVEGSPDFSAVPWTVNTDEGLENYTNGTPSLAATASSHNHPGQYDISLITPTFVLNAGPDGQSVRYDINFQRVDVFEFFDTNLSINGGDWITMTHEESSLGPAYSTGPPLITRGIDLTFYGAAVTDSARVEFRYYSTDLLPMVQNEYVQIDNVRIPTPVPEPASNVLAGAAAMLLIGGRQIRRTRQGRRTESRAVTCASEAFVMISAPSGDVTRASDHGCGARWRVPSGYPKLPRCPN
jgi:hypothetical protein